MALRERIEQLNSSIPSNEQAPKERIRESIFRLWFSIQKHVQKFDPTGSPSDYAERVEERIAGHSNGDGEISTVDSAVRRTVRDLLQNDRRKKFRQESRFRQSNWTEVESIADPTGGRFAAAMEEESHLAWQIEEIRRRVDVETMAILEQLYGFHSEQWTLDNLAKKMGIKRNTLEKRLARTFEKLRHELPFPR